MANSVYNMLGGGNRPQMGGPFGNMLQMVQKFNQFKQTFQGDPQQQIQQMLNSGKISQAQLNQYVELAKQFQSFIK